MKFDTVIIGGGLAGLVCGIRLAQGGRRCAIISAGQSALHFSSGSLDLLSALPDGESVDEPLRGVEQLVERYAEHPYSKLGVECFAQLAHQAEELLTAAGVRTVGSAERNHYRLSPMGVLRPTWLSFDGYVYSETPNSLRWRRVALFNAEGFLDFYPQFLSDELRRLGTQCHVHIFNLSALEPIRRNPTEMRSANIARIFDNKETLDILAEIIEREKGDAEAVLLPAVLGIDSQDCVKYLQQRLGCDVAVVATLPPSVPGLQVQTLLRRYFQELGGTFLLGDTVVDYRANSDSVESVLTLNHGDISFSAKNFVLATGSYFSRGLESDNGQIREALFNVDVAYADNRNEWYEQSMFTAQPYERFGIVTDDKFRTQRGGRTLENLYAIGAGLAGFNPVKEGCGAGVSILTAIGVAEEILSK